MEKSYNIKYKKIDCELAYSLCKDPMITLHMIQ